jgi:predicted nucleic acid-binding protein
MSVFVDTSALFALLDTEDTNHRSAQGIFKWLLESDELITHSYIHVEAEQLVRRRLGAAAAIRLLDELLPSVRTIWVDEALHAQAVAAVRDLGRVGSLVDQVSFMVMRQLGITTAFAFDADFDAEGFDQPRLRSVRDEHRLSEMPAPYGMPAQASELVSVAELAARSGRSVNTIQSWRRRHADFPPPSAELAAGPIWHWGDVSAWIARRSRPASPTMVEA